MTSKQILCECGCGNPAPISKYTSKRLGWIKGEPHRFILGHNGRVQTEEIRLKIGQALKGRVKSVETRKKLSEANKGKKAPWARNNKQVFKKGEHHNVDTEFKKGQPSWNTGLQISGMSNKHHSLNTKQKMKISSSGILASNWKGGISPLNKILRRSLKYRTWREAVFKRDNYTCVLCGARNGNGKYIELHPDHIKPFSRFPELRYEISNGRTLCIECHKKTDTYGGKARLFDKSS